jgi:hypothetical protein
VNLRDFGQLRIPTGERSGLQTHIEATKSVSLCMRRKSWALELPMAAPGYWKGNRAGGGAALPTSVTSNADKVWVVYLQA